MTELVTKVFTALHSGPSLLCLGAVHGNETCGTTAIQRLIHELETGELQMKSGTLTLVAICNPGAYARHVRYIAVNLNRLIGDLQAPDSYERQLASQLEPLIAEHDYTLDLHSNHTDGAPFIFQDTSLGQEIAFARALGVRDIVTGWPDMYQEEDFTTSGYAHAQGKISVTVECGQHTHTETAATAYAVLRSALDYLGLIPAPDKPPMHNFVSVRATHIHRKARSGKFYKNWQHMDRLKAGEKIARYDDGEDLIAQQDCHILLPFPEAQAGDEWFYTGFPEGN